MTRAAKQDKRGRTRCTIAVQHKFTVEEYQKLTQELTSEMKRVELREEAVKAAAATARAEVKQLKSHVNDLANRLRNGAEEREVEATVEMDRKKGVKRYYHFSPGDRELNGKLIRSEAMTEEDYEQLPLDEKASEEPQRPASEVLGGPTHGPRADVAEEGRTGP